MLLAAPEREAVERILASLFHIISAGPSKQRPMVRTFLKVYGLKVYGVRLLFLFLQEQIKDIIIIKGGVYAHEAYEADFFFSLCEYMEPTSLLFISVLLNKSSSNSAYYIHAIVL